MQEYVLGFAICGGDVLLVEHEVYPPANGVGGKVECNETPLMAMRREWTEETGLDDVHWTEVLILMNDSSVVYVYVGTGWDARDSGDGFIWDGDVDKCYGNVPHLVELCRRRLA